MLLFRYDPIAHIAHANSFLSTNVANKITQTLTKPEFLKDKRRATVERIAGVHVASMGGTLADSVGKSSRQRLVWLGLLAMPLLVPIALPGMSSMVGAFCRLIAYGLCIGQPVPLPAWLAKREMNGRVRILPKGMLNRFIHIIALLGRPRMLPLSNKPARVLNG